MGITGFTYDQQDRLKRIDYPSGNYIEYQYDLNGNRSQLKTANQTVDYTFDELNRLQTVTDSEGTTTYSYDAVGNRAQQIAANGVVTDYFYDDLNRLIDLQHTHNQNILASFSYELGPNGNRLSLTEGTGRVVEYHYDELYRLITETITDPINGDHISQWSYDEVGNRLQQEIDGVITTYQYDANDRLLSETENGVETGYVYDDNGNTLEKVVDNITEVTYSYSKDNRLIEAITPQATISYSYDAAGIRQSQTVDGITTDYLVDPNRAYHQVIEEQTDQIITYYTYGDDLISQHQNNISHTYGYDGLGSTRILTDSDGTVKNSYGYMAFGESDYQYGDVPNNYLFTGEQYDNNVGFYYLRARFYNPSIGRFQNMDTFAGMAFEPKSLHKYLYTHADPINNIDPSGNISIGSVLTTLSVAGIVNASIGVGLNILNPTVDNIWGDVGRDFAVGALLAPVGGVIGRVLGPSLRGMAKPVLQAVGKMQKLNLVGRSAWQKALIKMSRVFVTTNKGYPAVTSTFIGRALKRLFPQFKWQQHHIFIQQAWFRNGSAKQLYDDVAANVGLQRLGNAGWNLMPIPAKFNNWLGKSEVATQVFATFMYTAAVFGPTRLAMMADAAGE